MQIILTKKFNDDVEIYKKTTQEFQATNKLNC